MPRATKYEPRFDATRRFGVEIELISPVGATTLAQRIAEAAGVDCRAESYGHSRVGHWKVTTDGSVRPGTRQATDGMSGLELVSPPLRGEEGLEELRRVLRTLGTDGIGCEINRSCGLHVHHEANEVLGREGGLYAARLTDAYAEYEGVIDMLVPASRRGSENPYCKSMRRLQNDHTLFPENPSATGRRNGGASRTAMSIEDFLGRWGQDRYFKVNFESLFRHGTVEFRQHAGTLNAAKVVAWVVLTQLLLRRTLAGYIGKRTRSRTFRELAGWLRLDRDASYHGGLRGRDEVCKDAAVALAARFKGFCEMANTSPATAR